MPGDSGCLPEQYAWICCMVQNIGEKDEIERFPGKGNMNAIEGLNCYQGICTYNGVNPGYGDIRALYHYLARQSAISAAHIQQGCVWRDHRGKVPG
jgi:hypothetical protein